MKHTKNIVLTALLASLVCVATMIIKIPLPLNGYINLGDCIVLLAGWILSPFYGFIAAGVGSALADLFSGYIAYAPVTFVIKGLMALAVCFLYRLISQKRGDLLSRIVGGFAAEIFMVGGYFLFEGILYGFGASLANIPANLIQGAVGLVLGVLLIKLLMKAKIVGKEKMK